MRLKSFQNHEWPWKQFQSSKSGFAACSRSYSPFKQWFSHLLVIHWSFIGDLGVIGESISDLKYSENFTWPKSQNYTGPKKDSGFRKKLTNFKKFADFFIFDVYFRDFGVISKNLWFSGSSGIDDSRFTCIN